MLSTIREKTQGWIAAILLGMIGVPFALWGINSYFERGGNVTVARVGDIEIDVNQYHGALEQQRQALAQMLGKNVDPALFDSPVFKRQVLNGLIDRTLVRLQAEKAGYRVGDSQLSTLIQAMPEFQQNNRFDTKHYQQVLQQAGMTAPQFESRLRAQAEEQQVGDGYSDSAFATDAEVDRVALLQAQQRRVAYAIVPADRFRNTQVSNSDIEAYYKAHADQFQIPEQVRVQYIELSVAEIAKTISPSDDELRKAYRDEADSFSIPEERKASHILIAAPANATAEQQKKALAKVEQIRAQLKKGADFATLAREYSDDKGSAAHGGDLGFVRPGVMVKEFDSVLFQLKPGQVSEPVKTQYGYHLIKLTAVKSGNKKSFEQVKNELRDRVRQHQAEERFYDLSDKFSDLIYEHPDSLAQAAEVLKLPIQQSDWFSRRGGPGVASNPKVVEAAFSADVLQQHNNSNAVELKDSALLALRLAGHKPAATQPLSAVRTDIERELRAQQAMAQAGKSANALLDAARKDQDLRRAAKASGVTVQEATLARGKTDPKVDPVVSAAVFRSGVPAEGKPLFGSVALNGRGYAVYALEAVMPPTDATLAQAKTEARRWLQQRDNAGVSASYLSELRREIPVKVYEENL